MAQYSRPDSDVVLDSWTNPSWSSVDETPYDDVDYTSGPSRANATLQLGLSDVVDPGIHTGHTMRVRAYLITGVTLTFALYQGTTLIKSWDPGVTTGSFASYSVTLTEGEASTITDYTNLRFHCIQTYLSGSGTRRAYVSFVEIEVPPATSKSSKTAYLKGGIVSTEHAYLRGGIEVRSGGGGGGVGLLDDFNRATLGDNWSVSNLAINNNKIKTVTSGAGSGRWLPSTFGPEIEIYATLVDLLAFPNIQLAALIFNRIDTTHYYIVQLQNVHDSGASNLLIQLANGSSPVNLAVSGTLDWSATSSIGVKATYSAAGLITAYLDTGSGYESIISANNTTIQAEGHFLLYLSRSAGVAVLGWDDFGGGGPSSGPVCGKAYTKGINTTSGSAHAYLSGPSSFSSIPAYLASTGLITTSLPAYTHGESSTLTSKPTYLHGGLGTSQPAFMEAWGQDLSGDADVATNQWTNEDGSPIDLYLSLGLENDATYVSIPYAGIGDWFEIGLEDAGVIEGDDVYFEWRAWRISGTESVTMQAELRQDETIIATDEQLLSDTPTTYHRTLTPTEIDNIISVLDLRMRFVVTEVS